MPVILTTETEIEIWLHASTGEALKLQRLVPDGALRSVATARGHPVTPLHAH
jgi:hypothetical protein